MAGEFPPVSYFNRPFGASDSPPPGSNLSQQLSGEWETLETILRALGPEEGHRKVSEFLRRWGVTLGQADAAQQGALASLLESARASLLGQLSLAGQQQQASQWREAENRQRQALEQARHEARMEAGRAEVRRLQEETSRIQTETYRSGQLANERNHLLSKAALFPEQHCPHCARAYLDLSGGCWHCQHHHRPGYF